MFTASAYPGGTTNPNSPCSPIDAALQRDLLQEMSDRTDEIEQARRLPQDLADKMASAGLFRLVVPAQYGGLEAHPQVFFDTLVETARADSAVGWCLMIGTTTSLTCASLPDEYAQAIYGDDPDVITVGVTAPIGRADLQPDGSLRVNGRWPFGSGSESARWVSGGCTVYENGEPRRTAKGAPDTVLAVFERAQIDILTDTWDTSGLRGTGSHDFTVSDALVPPGRWVVLGARPRIERPLYRFPTLGLLALGVSAVAVGIAYKALDAFTALATAKTPTSAQRTLAQRSAIQKDFAQAQAALASAYALTREVIDTAWQKANAGERLDTETKAQLRLAATNNAWSASRAVDLVYHAGGGSSIYSKSPLQRCFRDVHVATQHIMVAQPTFEMVGKVGLGIDPKQPL